LHLYVCPFFNHCASTTMEHFLMKGSAIASGG
jgi:hypothetical protein